MSAMKNLGYDVYFLAYDNRSYYLIHNDEKKPLKRIFATHSFVFHHILSYICLYLSVLKVLRMFEWNKYDYAYIRSMPREFFWKRMKKEMWNLGMKIIVENPTYMSKGAEEPMFYIRFLNTVLKIFGKDKYTTLYTLIGDKTEGCFNGTPAINIDNGIDVDLFEPRTPISHTGINFIAVGNIAYWHGFDRIIKGLASFKEEDIHLYLVGPDGDGSLSQCMRLAEKMEISHLVHAVGPKFGEELTSLLNKCDVAFASLAISRKKLESASSLKNREYCARGIPFVFASEDPVLSQHPMEFVMQIPDDETPVPIKKVISFSKGLPNNEAPSIMRRYAEEYMTWESQFKKVFDYLESIN